LSAGASPQTPTGGAYSAPQIPYLYLGGLLLRDVREGEGTGRAEERTGETEGKGRPEREGEGRVPMTLWHEAPMS